MNDTSKPNSTTAANAGGNASGAGVAATAGTTVENLLKEFDSQSGSQPAPQPLSPELASIAEFAKAEMHTRAAAALDKDIKEAVGFLKQPDETKDLPDRLALGFLHALANENKEFADAWQNRSERPGTWKDALGKAQKEWIEEAKKLPTSKVRTEVEAAAAAVHGQTSTPSRSNGLTVAEMEKMNLNQLEDAIKGRGPR